MNRQLPKIVKGLDPVADAFDTLVYSDVISLKNHQTVEFLIYKGVGATGKSTITVNACDDTTPTTESAIPFYYQAITSGDTPGAVTAATAAGFTTTAGSSQLYRVIVLAKALAALEYEYVRLVATEVVNSPVVGCIVALLHDSRDGRDIPETAIV